MATIVDDAGQPILITRTIVVTPENPEDPLPPLILVGAIDFDLDLIVSSMAGIFQTVLLEGTTSLDVDLSASAMSGLQELMHLAGTTSLDVDLSASAMSGLQELMHLAGVTSIDVDLSASTMSGLSELMHLAGTTSIDVDLSASTLYGFTTNVSLAGTSSVPIYIEGDLDLGLPPSSPTLGSDNFADATPVSITVDGGTFSSDLMYNTGMTLETGEPGSGFKSVWWKYTPISTGTVVVDTQLGAGDTLLGVYESSGPPHDFAHLTLKAADDDSGGGATSLLTFMADEGAVYYIRVSSYFSTSAVSYVLRVVGPSTIVAFYGLAGLISLPVDISSTYAVHFNAFIYGSISFDVTLETLLVNDDFAKAELIVGTTGSTSGTTLGATDEVGEPVNNYEPGVWYSWVAPRDTLVRFYSTSDDVRAEAFTGSSLGALTIVNRTPVLDVDQGMYVTDFDTEKGTTYKIRVVATTTPVTEFDLFWEDLVPAPAPDPVDKLAFWHPINDEEVTEDYFDWSLVARASSEDKEFRVKNASPSYTAEAVVLSLEDLGISESTPSIPSQHYFSTDGDTFAAFATLDDLAPGNISGRLVLRRVTAPTASYGEADFQVVATATDWITEEGEEENG